MTEYEKYLNILSIVYYIAAAIVGLLSLFLLPDIVRAFGIALGFTDAGHFSAGVLRALTRAAGWNLLLLAIAWTIAWVLMLTARHLRERKGHTFCVVIASLLCLLAPRIAVTPHEGAAVHALPGVSSFLVLGVLTLIVLTREPVKHLFGVRLTPMPPAVPTRDG